MSNPENAHATEISNVPKKKTNNVLLITALMFGYSIIYMDKNMISAAIIPIAEQFNFTTSQTGLMMSLFFLGYSLMQIPSGWLADKIGYKKVLMFALFITSLFSFLFGFAGSLIFFILIRFFAGIGHAGYPPSCSKCVADNFVSEKRTFVQSLLIATSGIGGILAFSIGAKLIDLDWHYAYYALGSFFLLSFILVLIFVPDIKPVHSKANTKKEMTFTSVLSNRNVVILFIALMLVNVAYYGNMSWLPTFLKNKFSLSLGTVGTILTFNAVGGGLASVVAGYLLSKIFIGKEKSFLLICSLLSSIFFIGLVLTDSLTISIVLLYLLTFLLTVIFTGMFSWPHKILPANVIGSSIGIINTGSTLGGFLAPMTFGWLIAMAGGSFTVVFIALSVAMFLCGLFALAVKTK